MNRDAPESRTKRVLKGAALVGAGGVVGAGLGFGAGIVGAAQALADGVRNPMAPRWNRDQLAKGAINRMRRAPKLFSMKTPALSRSFSLDQITSLNAKVTKVTEFAFPNRQEEDSTLKTAGKVAAGVGAAGAVYGGASYLRGLMRPGFQKGAEEKVGGLGGVIANVKAGHSANMTDAQNAFGALKTAVSGAPAAVETAAVKVGAAATPVVGAASEALNKLKSAAMPATAAVTTGAKAATANIGNLLKKSRLFRGKM